MVKGGETEEVFRSADTNSQAMFIALQRQELLTYGIVATLLSMAECAVMTAMQQYHHDYCWP